MCVVEGCWVYGMSHLLSSLSPATYRLQPWGRKTDLCSGNGLGTNQSKQNHTNHLDTQSPVVEKRISWTPELLIDSHTTDAHQELTPGVLLQAFASGKKKCLYKQLTSGSASYSFWMHFPIDFPFPRHSEGSQSAGARADAGNPDRDLGLQPREGSGDPDNAARAEPSVQPPKSLLPTHSTEHKARIDILVYLRQRNKQRTTCFPAGYSNPGFTTFFCLFVISSNWLFITLGKYLDENSSVCLPR